MASLSPPQLEGLGRRFAQQLALTVQGCLLRGRAPAAVADGFIASRLADGLWGRVAGALDARAAGADYLLERALPAA